MTNEELEEAFRRGVDACLNARLHERRGLTAEQYVTLCRRLWDACPTSDEYPAKIIVDRCATLPELIKGAQLDYDDLRIRDCVDLYRVEADLYCISVGLFRHDGTPVSFNETTKPSFADPPEPTSERVILALLDVLGFENRLTEKGLEGVLSTYRTLLEKAVFVPDLRCTALRRLPDGSYSPAMFTLPVKYAYFSDTILLWVPLAQPFVAPFLARCADFVSEALDLGVPVRGAVAIGAAILHRPTSTFLGHPIVEAARLEAAQEWIGVALGPSCMWPPYLGRSRSVVGDAGRATAQRGNGFASQRVRSRLAPPLARQKEPSNHRRGCGDEHR